MNATDMNRLLRLVSWARLGLAALLLGLTPLIPPVLMPPDNVGVLALALFGIGASAGAILLVGGLTQPHRVAWFGCLLDIALVTAVVAASGGPRSIFTFLYVLAICAACLLLSRVGALALAAAASALYAGLVFGRVVFPITYFLDVPDETTALQVLTIFLNAGTLLTIAIVLGGLAQKSRTAQRQLETKQRDLQNLQAFRDVIFHSVSTGLIALDPSHKLTALNLAAETISGRTAGDAIGRPWAELFGPAIPLGVVEAEVAVSPTAPARYETTLTRPNGTAVPVRVTFSPLRSGEGNPLGLIAACEDLSEIRKMEARMRQA